MKLASLPQRRDGRLIVVTADLAWYADADHIVPTLQDALDDWDRHALLLDTLSTELEHGAIPRRRFHEREAAAPLPRAYRRTSAGADLPGDDLAPARSPMSAPFPPAAIELCAVTGEVAQGASPAEARAAIRLVGMAHGHGTGALSPVLALPAALDDPDLVLVVELNGAELHRLPLAVPDFGALVSDLAAERRLGPGTVVGAGALIATPALSPGDVIRFTVRCPRDHQPFGAIERKAG